MNFVNYLHNVMGLSASDAAMQVICAPPTQQVNQPLNYQTIHVTNQPTNTTTQQSLNLSIK
jgi:hypothetical protein